MCRLKVVHQSVRVPIPLTAIGIPAYILLDIRIISNQLLQSVVQFTLFSSMEPRQVIFQSILVSVVTSFAIRDPAIIATQLLTTGTEFTRTVVANMATCT